MDTHGAQAAVSMGASPPDGDGCPGAGGAAPAGPRPSPAGLCQAGTPEPAGPAAPLPNDGFAAETGSGSSGPTPPDTGTGGQRPRQPRGKGLIWALIKALVGSSSAAGGSQPWRDSPVPEPPCPSLVPVSPVSPVAAAAEPCHVPCRAVPHRQDPRPMARAPRCPYPHHDGTGPARHR